MDQNEKLASIIFKDEIRTTIHRYGRSLDLKDWDLFRSCVAETYLLDFTRLTGMPPVLVHVDTVVKWANAFFRPLRTHHTYSNDDIEILSPQRARAHVYMTSRHWRSTDLGESTNTQYGWYDFHFARLDGRWIIDRIKHDFAWIDGNGGLIDFTDTEMKDAASEVFSARNIEAAAHMTSPDVG